MVNEGVCLHLCRHGEVIIYAVVGHSSDAAVWVAVTHTPGKNPNKLIGVLRPDLVKLLVYGCIIGGE